MAKALAVVGFAPKAASIVARATVLRNILGPPKDRPGGGISAHAMWSDYLNRVFLQADQGMI